MSGGTIGREEVSNLRMTAGGEKRLRFIVLDGRLKEWVGIGWVDVRKATEDDKRRYKKVKP